MQAIFPRHHNLEWHQNFGMRNYRETFLSLSLVLENIQMRHICNNLEEIPGFEIMMKLFNEDFNEVLRVGLTI